MDRLRSRLRSDLVRHDDRLARRDGVGLERGSQDRRDDHAGIEEDVGGLHALEAVEADLHGMVVVDPRDGVEKDLRGGLLDDHLPSRSCRQRRRDGYRRCSQGWR